MLMIDGLVGVLRDLNVEEDKVQKVIRALGTSSQDLADGSFADARIPQSSFGGSEVAQELGYHHSRAQQVMQDTIDGMTKDLATFRDSVQTAARLVEDADQGAAGDLGRRMEVIATMQSVYTHSEGDRAYHESRNDPLPENSTEEGDD